MRRDPEGEIPAVVEVADGVADRRRRRVVADRSALGLRLGLALVALSDLVNAHPTAFSTFARPDRPHDRPLTVGSVRSVTRRLRQAGWKCCRGRPRRVMAARARSATDLPGLRGRG